MTDYKKYALGQLENFLYDAMSSGATPQEIYDVIKGVVEDNYYTYKKCASEAYELLALLNGNGKGHIPAYDEYVKGKENLVCDKEDSSPECKKSWNDFWEENYYPEEYKKDKVTKWQLPIEVDGPSGEYFVTFPDDLLDAANLKEGDRVEWVDQGDGSYLLRKVTKEIKMEDC